MNAKKLIEVALPLAAINAAAREEKAVPRHGHPQTLHYWWARRPLAAARAVIFAQMVDDPSVYVDVLRADPKMRRRAEAALRARLKLWEEACALANKAKGAGLTVTEPGPAPTLDDMLADLERQRLFRIIEDLVQWDNTTNEMALRAARDEIWQSWRRACVDNVDHPRATELFDRSMLPAFHDPFAGGGALPLEAQRLGLKSYASDLNPVAVLINKAMIEIPPRFACKAPVNPSGRETANLKTWKGAQGLAEDVRYYGQWVRDEAEKRIGDLYPKAHITAEMVTERPDLAQYVGRKLTVVAWLWARTVKSPNPAFAKVDVPLASTFMLSARAHGEAYVEPVVSQDGYRLAVRIGKPRDPELTGRGTKLARGANFQCIMSGSPISGAYIKAEGKAGRMGARLMAAVAEGDCGRVYLSPTPELSFMAHDAMPIWKPDAIIAGSSQYLGAKPYGMERFDQLHTNRQLAALATFTDLIEVVPERVRSDAGAMFQDEDVRGLRAGGVGAVAYSEAIAVYLSCALSRMASYNNTICTWNMKGGSVGQIFGRQAIPMTWDFIEVNPLEKMSGNWTGGVGWVSDVLAHALGGGPVGVCNIADAAHQDFSANKVVSTDPPYYDNVPYADLSDFFYVWLRRPLRLVFPALFDTLATPKDRELVAFAHRHGNKADAESFFLTNMTHAMKCIARQAHEAFPVTIYYAFKQAETESDIGTASTGWETFLQAVISAGFSISGTWPMRTERDSRLRGQMSNALASSIVLVCRPRDSSAPVVTRREFIAALKSDLPEALDCLQRSNIAPVDLAQAAIGPGMAVYTRFSAVIDAEGKALAVRGALTMINQILDEALAEQEGDFDADTRWALTWFGQHGFSEGEYGVAEQLSKSKVTSVPGMVDAGIVVSSRGKVRLLRPEELPADWDPATDVRLTAWETVHHLIRVLAVGGEGAAADLVSRLGAKAEVARELCYRLYTLCERKKRADDALAYNGLVQSWPEISRLARDGSTARPKIEQGGLFGRPEE